MRLPANNMRIHLRLVSITYPVKDIEDKPSNLNNASDVKKRKRKKKFREHLESYITIHLIASFGTSNHSIESRCGQNWMASAILVEIIVMRLPVKSSKYFGNINGHSVIVHNYTLSSLFMKAIKFNATIHRNFDTSNTNTSMPQLIDNSIFRYFNA